MEKRLLSVYLNDHLAGSVAGVELARRSQRSNEGGELGDFLAGLTREIEEDRGGLLAVMRALDVSPSRVKPRLAWVAEKAGRLKLNGRLLSYSPLSRLVELEALVLGVTGKKSLWDALAVLAPAEPRLAAFDFAALAERAQSQIDGLERCRREAVSAL